MRSANRRQIDRRVVLWTGLFLLLAHVGLKAALEADVRILDQARLTQGVRFIRKGHAANSPRIAVALFGSSRMNDGAHPPIVMSRLAEKYGIDSEAFNFARPGGGPAQQFLCLRRLAERGATPDVAVIEILPQLLIDNSGSGLPTEEVEASILYPAEVRELRRRGWLPPATDPWREMFATTPWFENRSALLQRVAPRWGDTLVDVAVGPNDRGGNLNLRRAYPSECWDRTVQHLASVLPAQYRVFAPNAAADEAIIAALDECRHLGVCPVLVLMPESPTYRGFYGPGAGAKLEDYGRATADRHGALFVNARPWFDDEALFIDSHHLHKDGAEIFSERLADAIGASLRSGAFVPRTQTSAGR